MADFGKAALTQVGELSQFAKANNKKGIYNINYLKKIKNIKRFSINVLGDSIAAGSNATSNFGFIPQLENALNVAQQKVNYSFGDFYYDANAGTWTKEEVGINKHLLSSIDTSSSLQISTVTAQIPTSSYNVIIVYSKRPDGGSFEVRESSTNALLTTVNCNGTSADGLKTAELTVAASNSVKIVPLTGNKAYVNGWIRKLTPSEASYKVHNLAQGGRKAKDFLDADLVNSVKFEKPDLLIWELIANDFGSGGDLAAYKQKTELAITTAQANGSDVLIVATCGNSTSETNGYRDNWISYLRSTADKYKCALVDFDEIFGGYTNANASGLMSDTIHPNDAGHLLMGNILINVLLDTSNPYSKSIVIDTADFRRPYYNSTVEPTKKHYTVEQFFEDASLYVPDGNGNPNYKPVMSIISITGSAQFPKYARIGQLVNYSGVLYVNTTDWGTNKSTSLATWSVVYTFPKMETLTALPTGVTDAYLDRIFRLSVSGKDDQIVTYVKTAAGGRQWVKLTLDANVSWT